MNVISLSLAAPAFSRSIGNEVHNSLENISFFNSQSSILSLVAIISFLAIVGMYFLLNSESQIMKWILKNLLCALAVFWLFALLGWFTNGDPLSFILFQCIGMSIFTFRMFWGRS